MADVEAMCHWAGLKVRGAGTLPQAVYPSPGFVWPANESGLGALRRYLADQAVVLRSARRDTEQDHTHVAVLPLPSRSSYTYVVAQRPGRGLRQPRDFRLGADARRPRRAAVCGRGPEGAQLGRERRGLGDGAAASAARTARGPCP